LPNIVLKTKLVEGTTQVFDVVRQKYFILTAEEWVRQHLIHYLNRYKNYPFGLMAVERMIKYNNLKTRADIVLYNSKGDPDVIVECKASNIKITQGVFDQISRYNFKLRVRYLLVTNGINHFCCEMDYATNKIVFLSEIPVFDFS
jgi:type I site-specific restriction endonuclease